MNNITQTTFSAKTYLAYRKEIDIKDIMDPALWQNAYGKVHTYIKKHNLTLAGPGAALYFRWDEPNGKGELAIGNPVTGVENIDDPDLSIIEVPESKAVMLTVQGDYKNFPANHELLRTYCAEYNFTKSLVIEEYVVTGMDTEKPEEWRTNLYHLYT